MVNETHFQLVQRFLYDAQNKLCAHFENQEKGVNFIEDLWDYAGGGGGRTKILANTNLIEKGGVNVSSIQGNDLPKSATKKRVDLANKPFRAMGISIVIHPNNPFIPTVHGNVRLMAVKMNEEWMWWFGGGVDLTPYYPFEEDCVHWHKTIKSACDTYGKNLYPKFKEQCDQYFYLKHREEARGIGGIFFDDLILNNFEESLSFIRSIFNALIEGYFPILIKRKSMPFGEKEKEFQNYRRGRYVEFNLLYDRGTLFGLQSGGRVESILMSLPPKVSWAYNRKYEDGTPESKLTQYYLKPRDWVNF